MEDDWEDTQSGLYAFGGKCFNCWEVGHTRAECTKPPTGQYQRGRGSRGRGQWTQPGASQPVPVGRGTYPEAASVARMAPGKANGRGATRGNRRPGGRGKPASKGRGQGGQGSQGLYQMTPTEVESDMSTWYQPEGTHPEDDEGDMEVEEEAKN